MQKEKEKVENKRKQGWQGKRWNMTERDFLLKMKVHKWYYTTVTY